jgi:hypothetical protein
VQIYPKGSFRHLQRCRGCGINLLGINFTFKEINRKNQCSEKGKLREIEGRKAEDLSPARLLKRGYGDKQNKIARLPKQRSDNARMPVAAKFRRGLVDTGMYLMKRRPVGVFCLRKLKPAQARGPAGFFVWPPCLSKRSSTVAF